ncbi:MAG: PEGA domain-containing protein [Planctomycetes bacterium]|nr:PEGA domain-containing protein [Planctomycetota bacterium]
MRTSATLLLLALAACAPGCVERQLVIETDPPGAELFVDGREVGTTAEGAPVRVTFDAYGTRTVVARRRGHVPLRRTVTLDPPWWQLFPFDVFTDLLWLGTLRDEHRLELALTPRAAPDEPEALEARARHMGLHEEKRP